MAEIFLSYAREDIDRARRLATALEGIGWSVFWDRTIPAGKNWRQHIGGVLDAVECVVVVWSSASIESDWVQEEADEGRTRRILVPVLFEPVVPPLGFRSIQAADLSEWDGAKDAPSLARLVEDITGVLGRPVLVVAKDAPPKAPPEEQRAELIRAESTKALLPTGDAKREPQEEPDIHGADVRGEDSQAAKRRWPLAAAGIVLLALVLVGLFFLPRPQEIVGLTKVPDLTNLPKDDARRVLDTAGVVLGSVTETASTSAEPGDVIGQDPVAGAKIERGSAVSIVLAKPIVPVAAAQPQDPSQKTTLKTFSDALKDGSKGPEMVVVPSGSYRMGRLGGHGDLDEVPVRTVTISKSFAIGKYETTFEEYDRFAKATGRELHRDEGWGRGNRPVMNVSWKNAQAYAAWISEQTGSSCRLPTEAEWEYACRADTETKYPWGNELGRGNANCRNCGSRWGDKQTAPVGSFKPNAWGLHDMSGNVSEWVEDCAHLSYKNELTGYTGAPTDGSAWLEDVGGSCEARVYRGGSWFDSGGTVRCAQRKNNLGFRGEHATERLGFRLVCSLPNN